MLAHAEYRCFEKQGTVCPDSVLSLHTTCNKTSFPFPSAQDWLPIYQRTNPAKQTIECQKSARTP